MTKELALLLDGYTRWLRDKTDLSYVNSGYAAVSTPFLDRNNDYIQIYVRRDSDGYVLTDGGETIQDLRLSGCDVDTERRGRILATTLNGFGVLREGDALTVRATSQDFPLKRHNLVQAILAVDDMFYLTRPIVAGLFVEDVAAWFERHDVRFTAGIKLTGKSGYDHTFNFVIPASRQAPERLVRAINSPSRRMAESVAFAWIDVRDARPPSTVMYAIINDESKDPGTEMVDALKRHGVIPALWSQRDDVIDQFVA